MKTILSLALVLFATNSIFAATSNDTDTDLEWCKEYEAKEELKEGLICDSGIKNEEKLVELIDYLSDEAFLNMKTEMNIYIDQKLQDKIKLSQEGMKKYQEIE